MKVLLIDDEKNFHKILKILSDKFCFEVSCVYTIADAKRECDATVDVAIIDYELPDGDGVSLNKYIKKRFPKIKTVLCTGYTELMDESLSETFDHKLNKSEIVPFVGKLMRQCNPTT